MSKYSVVIIDYGSGNLRSVAKAFEKIARDHSLNLNVIVSDQKSDLEAASHIVLPGQGAFGDCMNGLKNSGLLETLESHVLKNRKPFLGICVGMQLLADEGLEHGHHQGLGWIGGKVVPLSVIDPSLKIPHMGWNEYIPTEAGKNHNVLSSIDAGTHFYFVHSYVFECNNKANCLAQFDYGGMHTAVIGQDNILGIQFHPEKSHDNGLFLLNKFLNLS